MNKYPPLSQQVYAKTTQRPSIYGSTKTITQDQFISDGRNPHGEQVIQSPGRHYERGQKFEETPLRTNSKYNKFSVGHPE